MFLPTLLDAFSNGAGILLRQSSTGRIKVLTLGYHASTYLLLAFYASPTDSGSQIYFHRVNVNLSAPAIWLRFTDDGTDTSYGFSLDGQNFLTVHTDARADWFTGPPDEIGFAVIAPASYDSGATLIHWSLPNPTVTMRAFGMFGVIPSFKPTGNAFGAFG